MSKSCAEKISLDIHPSTVDVELGDQSVIQTCGTTEGTFAIGGVQSSEQILLVDMNTSSERPLVIVGRMWLKKHNPRIDWATERLHGVDSQGLEWTLRPLQKSGKPAKPVTFKSLSLRGMRNLVRRGDCELFVVRVTPKLAKWSFRPS